MDQWSRSDFQLSHTTKTEAPIFWAAGRSVLKYTKLLVFSALFLLVFLPGCGTKSNLTGPREWIFKPEKVWEIQQANDNGGWRPAEPRIADDGTLYFREFTRNLSYIIDTNGNSTGTFAPKGDNTGEVPFYINCFTADDKVVIAAMDKLHYFNEKGEFIRTVDNNIFISFPLAFKNENEYWTGPGALGDAPDSMAVVTHKNLLTGKEDTTFSFDRIDEEKRPTGGALVPGLTPQIKMAYDQSSDRIYFGKNSDTVIYSAPANGGKVKSFSFSGTRPPVSMDDKRAHFAGHDIPEEAVNSIIGNLPDRMVYYNQIKVFNGLVYIFSSESIAGNQTGEIVSIYSPDGFHLYYGRIDVEDGWFIFSGPDNMQLTDGYLYVVQQNDERKKKIVRYKINLPLG